MGKGVPGIAKCVKTTTHKWVSMLFDNKIQQTAGVSNRPLVISPMITVMLWVDVTQMCQLSAPDLACCHSDQSGKKELQSQGKY